MDMKKIKEITWVHKIETMTTVLQNSEMVVYNDRTNIYKRNV